MKNKIQKRIKEINNTYGSFPYGQVPVKILREYADLKARLKSA